MTDLADRIMTFAESTIASPWIYVAIIALALADAVFPIVPSESLVITAGVFVAATGAPDFGLVIAAAAIGAFVGDHACYALGRFAGQRAGRRRRVAELMQTGGRMLARRGGMMLVTCRYIPGARTAVALTAGAVRYPLRKFSPFDALATLSWAIYSAGIGYIGGEAFESSPWKGLALGITIAIAISGATELVRHLRARSASGPKARAVSARAARVPPA